MLTVIIWIVFLAWVLVRWKQSNPFSFFTGSQSFKSDQTSIKAFESDNAWLFLFSWKLVIRARTNDQYMQSEGNIIRDDSDHNLFIL